MRKVYLVDSENVGDVWVPLLVSSQPDDEVLVFYTLKSPHMNYENVRILKETEKEAVFIKCFEGSNALDFQLVSELGYRLREDLESEYIVVSNDTGFDAVIRYWAARNMRVSRLSGKECYRNLVAKRQRREQRENGGLGVVRSESETEVRVEGQAGAVEVGRGEAEPAGNGPVTGTDVHGEAEGAQSALESGADRAAPDEAKTDMSDQVAAAEVRPESEPGSPSRRGLKSESGAKAQEELRFEGQAKSQSEQKPEKEIEPQSDLKSGNWAKPQRESKSENRAKVGSDRKSEDEVQGEGLHGYAPCGDVHITAEAQVEEASDGQAPGQEERVVKTLFRCISKENLVDFHNALVAFLGEEEGKALYQEIKGSAECTAYWSTLRESSQREKFEMYCALVFAHSDFGSDVPEDFAGFLFQANGKRKNLNSLRAALQGQYGKDRGMKYYSLFKSHIKIMNRM